MAVLAYLVPAVVLASILYTTSASPSNPVAYNPQIGCPEEGYMYADDDSLCWYHLCLKAAEGYLYTIPRRCSLGTQVDYKFVEGFRNPCTVNLNTHIGYECKRGRLPADVAPSCANNPNYKCHNGGTLAYEANNCWCLCPLGWEGDSDCSKPTGYNAAAGSSIEGSSICVGGQPDDDYCYKAGGCDNGGICYNQCRGFWCDCPDVDEYVYTGKRCETKRFK